MPAYLREYQEKLVFQMMYLQLERNVLSTNARVTRFAIDWGDSETITSGHVANGEQSTVNNEEAQKNLETDFEIQNKENNQQQSAVESANEKATGNAEKDAPSGIKDSVGETMDTSNAAAEAATA